MTSNPAALVVAAAILLLALAFSASASAQSTICTPGPGAGKCSGPGGVAVDREKSLLYVADSNNNRVDVFKADGAFVMAFGWGVADGTTNALQTCTATCFQGIAGPGAGQLRSPSFIAVDNAAASASHHDVYVVEDPNHRVQKFDSEGHFLRMFGKGVNTGASGKPNLCTNAGAPSDVCGQGSEGGGTGEFHELGGIGVDGAGLVDVADAKSKGPCTLPGSISGLELEKRVQRFEGSGEPIAQLPLTGAPCGRISGFAVTSGGNVYLANEDRPISKYDPAGTLLNTLPGLEGTTALGVDGADDLFVAQREKAPFATLGTREAITEYDPSDTPLRRFGYGEYKRVPRVLAPFHTANGEVFVGTEEPEGVKYLGFPPPGPVIASLEVASIRSTKTTLNVETNPEGKETKVRIDLVSQSEFEASGFSGGGVKHSAEVAIGSDFSLHGTSLVATGLAPSTQYRYRAVATNSEGSQTLEGAPFETLAPFEILGTWVTDVGNDAARLHASVNPLESPAKGYFEYVDQTTYEASGFAEATRVPSPASLDFGSGEAPVTKGAVLYPLAPGTTYRYRVTVEDPFTTKSGPERAFTTFAPPGQPNTNCPNQAFRTSFSAALPDCRAYEMVSPVDKNNGDIVPRVTFTAGVPAALNESSLDGSKLTFSSATAFGDAQAAPWNSQYLSARGGGGWSTKAISPPMELPVGGTVVLFSSQYKAFSPDLCSGWLVSAGDPPLTADAVERFPNIYRRSNCGEAGYEALTTVHPPHEVIGEGLVNSYFEHLELQGLSADGSKAIYVAADNLTPETPSDEKGFLRLYARGEGQLRYACILPSGVPIADTAGCAAGDPSDISGDGVTANVKNAISADGSRVYWTSYKNGVFPGAGPIYLRENPYREQSPISAGKCSEPELACTVAVSETVSKEPAHFLAASADGSRAIFSLHVSGAPQSESLYEFDAAQGTSSLIAAEAKGVMGESEDLSRIYFVTTKDLGGGGKEGEPNLYLYEAGEGGPGSYSFIATLAATDVSGPSPISSVPYQRTSRVSPDGGHAAFMSAATPTGYDNADAKSGKADAEVYLYDAAAHKLLCASCNPSGARPAGANLELGNLPLDVASQIPVWQGSLYSGRVLSEDGRRLYFESVDALVATDTNGVGDVYQWEAPGEGDCTKASPAYTTANEGCVSLISSGQSPRASQIIDISPDGHDVFIRTLSGLLPQDNALVDIYDAREGGGLPPPPSPPAACEGEACQGPPAPPNDPTPGSSSFEGAGNVVEKPAKKKHRKKHAKKHKSHKKTKRNGRPGR